MSVPRVIGQLFVARCCGNESADQCEGADGDEHQPDDDHEVHGLDGALADRCNADVGLAEEEDDFDFEERFTSLKAEFEAQLLEETKLNARIAENLARVQMP